MKVKRLRAPRLLTLGMGGGEDLVTLGTDFSGMGGGEACFAKLSVNYALIFSCDNSSACEKLLKHKYKPKVFFPDILLRKPEEEQYVDAYVWAAPCQPYSSAGKQQGSADARGGPMMDAAVGFIRRQRPSLTVMENVCCSSQELGIYCECWAAEHKVLWSSPRPQSDLLRRYPARQCTSSVPLA